MTKSVVLVVAAGRGSRFGGDLPKQYALFRGAPILRHVLEGLCRHPRIAKVIVAIHPDDRAAFDVAAQGLPVTAVNGGAERQESVRLGLEALAADAPDFVLIHDGARPVFSPELIDRVLDGLAAADAIIPAVPVIDTLKRIDGAGAVTATVPRQDLVRAQTPQGFRFAAILAAHKTCAGEALTDDAAVMERSGHTVRVVPGEETNIKVTTSDDLARLNGQNSETRTGSGFDVHRFGPGAFVTLCGLQVPHTHGLLGHSDADVALHAGTDAILGAIGAGDIGQHFPPTDPQWRGAPSDKFIQHAYGLLRARGGSLIHLDFTIICERPKVGPHREAMAASVARILDIDPGRISVKATTTEGLGFTGRNEGIAAQAIATVRL